MFVFIFLFFLNNAQSSVREALFQNSSYNPIDSPYDINGQTIVIRIAITYVVLAYMEENKQIVTYILNVEYSWLDPRLQFDAAAAGINYLIVPSNLVWIPIVDCYNCLDVHNMDMETANNEVQIFPNGSVRIFQKSRFETLCRTEIGAFPFDTQYCGIYFDAGLSETDRVVFDPENIGVDIEGSPEWSIFFQTASVNNSRNYSLAVVSFKLVRNSQFYVIFLILPTMVVSSVSLASILLPMDMSQGEKINMGITGLLGLTFLLGIIVQEVPRAKKLPVLGQWLIVEMFICIFTLIMDAPLKAIKKRLDIFYRLWIFTVDTVAFVVIFLGNIIFTVLIFTLPPKNNFKLTF